MIWIFIIAVITFFIVRFLIDLNKDNHDLHGRKLSEKFKFIVDVLNETAFNGKGTVTQLDKRSFNLYHEGQNQIINFTYSTGNLTITWRYKYFQKEVVHEKQFNDTRNLSIFEQQSIAEIMINEMVNIIAIHKNNVLRKI